MPSELLPKIEEKAGSLNLSSNSSTLKISLAMPAYDSVWALALAYHGIVVSNVSTSQEELTRQLNQLKFHGASVSSLEELLL